MPMAGHVLHVGPFESNGTEAFQSFLQISYANGAMVDLS